MLASAFLALCLKWHTFDGYCVSLKLLTSLSYQVIKCMRVLSSTSTCAGEKIWGKTCLRFFFGFFFCISYRHRLDFRFTYFMRDEPRIIISMNIIQSFIYPRSVCTGNIICYLCNFYGQICLSKVQTTSNPEVFAPQVPGIYERIA